MSCHIMCSAPTTGHVRNVEEIRAVVQAVDLSRYVADLRHYEGLDADEAGRCAELFKKFCIVAAANPGVYVWDHKEADQLLHAFLKYQPDYPEFCAKVFGGLLHHRPMLPGDDLPEAVETTIARTRKLWEQTFPGQDFDSVGTVYH